MVKKDMIAQLLVGNELKQDQFRFMYDTIKIIYDSALQNKLVNLHDKKNEAIESTVIPELIAFHSLLRIRNIQLTKAREIKEAKEKAERNGNPALAAASVALDPTHMTEEQILQKRLDDEANKKMNNMSENQKQLEAERQERLKYGRFWIWESYFNEKNQGKWLETAEALKHINDHVLQDIEDHILVKGFGKEKPEKIRQMIENDH